MKLTDKQVERIATAVVGKMEAAAKKKKGNAHTILVEKEINIVNKLLNKMIFCKYPNYRCKSELDKKKIRLEKCEQLKDLFIWQEGNSTFIKHCTWEWLVVQEIKKIILDTTIKRLKQEITQLEKKV